MANLIRFVGNYRGGVKVNTALFMTEKELPRHFPR